MRISRASVVAAAVAATATSGLTLVTTPAVADPGAGITTHQLVGVGSDATQDVLDALAGETVNGTSYAGTAVSADGYTLASYDATAPGAGSTPSQIQTRTGGPTFLRPNGANAGRVALSDSVAGGNYAVSANQSDGTTNIGGQIDFARNTSTPAVSGNALTAIPFARDAVGYAAKGSALAQLTKQQLHDIYTGSLTEIGGVTVHPFIPNSGSGTRSFFQKAIGVTDAQLGADVATLDYNGNPVQQNRLDDVVKNDGDIVPLSVASFVAQHNGVAPDRSATAVAAGAFIGTLDEENTGSFTPPVLQNADGSISSNPAFFGDATFGRDVSNVVASRAVDPTSIFFNRALYDVFVTDATHTAGLDSAAAQSVIAKFGFLNVSYNGVDDPTNKHVKLGGLEDPNLSSAVPAAPALTATPAPTALTLAWAPAAGASVTDYRVTVQDAGGAPVSGYSYQDVAASTPGATLTGLTPGSYTVTVYAANINGISSATTSAVTVPAAATAAKVTATASASAATGTWLPIHVTVAPTAGRPVPTGRVTLNTGATALLDAKGQATLSILTSRYPLGTRTFTVSYAGDANTLAAQTTVRTTIVKATPTFRIAGLLRFAHSQHAKYTITVSAPNTLANGWVRVYSGSRLVGSAWVSNGRATLTLSLLSRGRHALWFHYYGNGLLNPVTHWVTVTVS